MVLKVLGALIFAAGLIFLLLDTEAETLDERADREYREARRRARAADGRRPGKERLWTSC